MSTVILNKFIGFFITNFYNKMYYQIKNIMIHLKPFSNIYDIIKILVKQRELNIFIKTAFFG